MGGTLAKKREGLRTGSKQTRADTMPWSIIGQSALAAHAMLAKLDADGKIVCVNDRFCAISQFSNDELVGCRLPIPAKYHDSQSFLAEINKAFAQSGEWHGVIENIAKDGSAYWAETTIVPYVDQSGASAGYIVAQTDITRLKSRELELRSNLDLLQAIFEHFPGGISCVSEDLVLMAANRMFYRLLDIPDDKFPVGSKYEDVIRFNAERGDYGDGEPEEQVRDRVQLAKTFEKHDFRRKRPNGTTLEVRGFPLPEGGFVSTYVDVTERTKVEALNMRLARIIEDSFNEVYVFDAKTLKFLQVNKSACQNLGYTMAELSNLTPLDLNPEFALEDLEHVFSPLRTGKQSHIRFETVHRRKNGSVYDVEITLQHIRADDQAVFAAVVEDIAEKRQNELQIAHMAMHDALTDLPNRILLNERLEHALERVKRGETFAVLCLDLDRFKTINDTLGHAVGDELLKATAERLVNCVRGTDTVARLEGDEFAVIQIPSGYPKDAANIARRIGDAIKRPFNIQGRQITIESSIGIAVAPKDGNDPETLLHKADMAMHRAKADGRGTIHFFEPELDARMQVRQQLELDLKKGLNNEEFELQYQPIVNLQTERIAVLEALLRWKHPERGMVPPMDFIPIAEETGLIREIGEWVLRKACADALTWPEEVKVAVNLSPIQFQNQSLALRVTKALADTGCPASRLELEITESMLMQDTDEALATLHQLRDLGVKISMDDFGSGYSSLGYLRSFPFDKVKIDRSFTADLAGSDGAIAIVQAIAGLCSQLGIATTAEGIETIAQLDRVLNLGCTEMQGFLYSPPRPLEEIMRLFFPNAKTNCAA